MLMINVFLLVCGCFTPPVGLNLFVVNAIAPDVPTSKVLWGSVPYIIMMIVGLIILSIFPGIATWLPDHLMGIAAGPR
jgi:TRAP-type C4-dicarboxylate transport system permease large subunit